MSGSKDRGVQFWDPQTGNTQLMLQGHKNSGKCFHAMTLDRIFSAPFGGMSLACGKEG